MTFDEALKRSFRFTISPDLDNLPILAIDRAHVRDRSSLARVSADMGLVNGVEIGTADGYSARLWCDTNPALRLTCIDPYVPYGGRRGPNRNNAVYEQARSTLAAYPQITLLRETSMDAVRKFSDKSIEFLHIDGNHHFDACVMDLVCWVPKVKPGGLITVHDYCPFWQAGVMKAVDAYTHCHRIDPWYVVLADSLTVFWERGAERVA